MSKRHVEEYYAKMYSDYRELKKVLEELQNTLTEEAANSYVSQIESIKEKVRLLEANYKRLSYIIFLLNKPNRKKKETKYIRSESKKLNAIPEKDREEAVIQENKSVLDDIKNMI